MLLIVEVFLDGSGQTQLLSVASQHSLPAQGAPEGGQGGEAEEDHEGDEDHQGEEDHEDDENHQGDEDHEGEGKDDAQGFCQKDFKIA